MQAQSVQSATCLSSITLHLGCRWLIDTLDHEGNTIQTDRFSGGCAFNSDHSANCYLPVTPAAVLRQYVDSKYCRAASSPSSGWGFCMHVLACHVAEDEDTAMVTPLNPQLPSVNDNALELSCCQGVRLHEGRGSTVVDTQPDSVAACALVPMRPQFPDNDRFDVNEQVSGRKFVHLQQEVLLANAAAAIDYYETPDLIDDRADDHELPFAELPFADRCAPDQSGSEPAFSRHTSTSSSGFKDGGSTNSVMHR